MTPRASSSRASRPTDVILSRITLSADTSPSMPPGTASARLGEVLGWETRMAELRGTVAGCFCDPPPRKLLVENDAHPKASPHRMVFDAPRSLPQLTTAWTEPVRGPSGTFLGAQQSALSAGSPKRQNTPRAASRKHNSYGSGSRGRRERGLRCLTCGGRAALSAEALSESSRPDVPFSVLN